MRYNLRSNIIFLFFISCSFHSYSQDYFFPLNHSLLDRYDAALNKPGNNFHSSIKPFTFSTLRAKCNADSIDNSLYSNAEKKRSLAFRKIRKENLLVLQKEDFSLVVDPIAGFEVASDKANNDKGFVNTRGLQLSGSVGKKVFFNSTFRENQTAYVNYIDNFIGKYNVVPGQGYPKRFKNDPQKYDFGYATGYVAYAPSKFFNLQLGSDKNFIGDGYRSLLLSDNSFPYPFFKITTTVWKIKYMNLYTTMLDIRYPAFAFNIDDFHRKYNSMHYLSMNVTRRWSLGLFESVVFRKSDSTSNRGFDWNYLNPVIFMRPVEYSLGSSDNALMGFNSKYKFSKNFYVYAQLILDEFKIGEVRAGKGWYANKQGFQVGFKYNNAISIKNLNWRCEYNFVRPFTYSHYNLTQSYTHYGQALAHPLGANFWEALTFLNYRYRSIFAEVRISSALYGDDIYDPVTKKYQSYGKDIFRSYYDHRPGEYGYFVGGGDKTVLVYNDVKAGYIINPKTNLLVEAGISIRSIAKSISTTTQVSVIHFGLKTSISNFYFDF